MKKLTNLITIVMIAITMLQCKKSEATNTANDNSAKTSQKHSEEKENHKHDEKDDLKYVSKEIKVTGGCLNTIDFNGGFFEKNESRRTQRFQNCLPERIDQRQRRIYKRSFANRHFG